MAARRTEPDLSYIWTNSGARFYVKEMNVEDIPIEDIAHALSNNCRYNGHLNEFYSVAEHCLIVSRMVPKEYALEGLLHDACEAFVPDVPRPFKSQISGFKEYEDRLERRINEAYGLPPEPSHHVKYIDYHIVASEARRFFSEIPEWAQDFEDIVPQEEFIGMPPAVARYQYLQRYESLLR